MQMTSDDNQSMEIPGKKLNYQEQQVTDNSAIMRNRASQKQKGLMTDEPQRKDRKDLNKFVGSSVKKELDFSREPMHI